MGKLTDVKVRGALKSGIYGDGDRLYLRVQGSAKSWLFIYTFEGRRREMGLGGYPAVSLQVARGKAQDARNLLATGVTGDPIGVKVAAKVRATGVPTLASVCEEWVARQVLSVPVAARYRAYIANQLSMESFKGGSKNAKTRNVASAHVLGGAIVKHKISIADVTVNDIERILLPVWATPTGPYVRSFLERVFDYAMVKGYMPRGLNPAALRGNLEHVLPKVRRVTEHHASLPWVDVPTQYRTLEGHGANALRFTILTASRQIEVREMTWREVQGNLWTIPANRYKTRRPHVVPLAPAALALLPPRGNDDALVWGRTGDHTFTRLLNGACDPHGFRTSFAVWCVEQGGFADDLAQRCLGHVVGTAVTRAYQRSDFIEPRRRCLEAWAAFVSAGTYLEAPHERDHG